MSELIRVRDKTYKTLFHLKKKYDFRDIDEVIDCLIFYTIDNQNVPSHASRRNDPALVTPTLYSYKIKRKGEVMK